MSSVKRYGPRYGRKAKEKLSKIEAERNKRYKCPYCRKPSIKRESYGIWYCKSCGKKFTGKAYSIREGSSRMPEKEDQ